MLGKKPVLQEQSDVLRALREDFKKDWAAERERWKLRKWEVAGDIAAGVETFELREGYLVRTGNQVFFIPNQKLVYAGTADPYLLAGRTSQIS